MPPGLSVAEVVLQHLVESHGENPELTAALVVEVVGLFHAAARANPEEALPTTEKVRKVSVSMPADLIAAVQQRVGPGEFSRYVSDAVAHQHRQDLLAELSALLDEEYGPVPQELIDRARAEWPDR